jgi:rsbT antagonist protein RsbS
MARTIPIIELHRNLIVAIQTELSDRLVAELKDDLGYEIQRRDVQGLVIEVSGVDIFDTFIAHSVREIAQVVRLMGIDTVLAGLDPSMAITLVEMGMTMQGVETAMNLESALEILMRKRAATAGAGLPARAAGADTDEQKLVDAMIAFTAVTPAAAAASSGAQAGAQATRPQGRPLTNDALAAMLRGDL